MFPPEKTINICADTLYNSDLRAPSFPREVLIKLMQTATKSIEFSFNSVMCQQIDKWCRRWLTFLSIITNLYR